MIKDYVARAIQMAMLTKDQIEQVQSREKEYLVANWNIQVLFGLAPLKESLLLPEDAEKQLAHNARIEAEINRLKLRFTENYENILEWWHMFDWNVFYAREKIDWSYQGQQRSRRMKDLLNSRSYEE